MARQPIMPNAFTVFSLDAPAPASDEVLSALRACGLTVDTTPLERAEHGRDWWPLTIPDVARGHVPQWPGVVVRPSSSEDVSRVLEIASKHRVAVTAQGGRSNVVGGAVAPEGAIALDLTGLNRVLAIET